MPKAQKALTAKFEPSQFGPVVIVTRLDGSKTKHTLLAFEQEKIWTDAGVFKVAITL